MNQKQVRNIFFYTLAISTTNVTIYEWTGILHSNMDIICICQILKLKLGVENNKPINIEENV